MFRLYDQLTGGHQVGSDMVHNAVPVDRGLFTVRLEVPADRFDGQALWLERVVDGQPLSPRQEILPVPYALGLRPGARLVGQGADPVLLVAARGVGSTTALSVTGLIGLDALGEIGVLGRGDTGVVGRGVVGVRGFGAVGNGVYGHREAAAAVYGESSGSYGVHGNSHFADGVHGETSHGFSAGVSGSGPTGVFGRGGMVGVSGYSPATGVMGAADGENGQAVVGRAIGFGGTAVVGEAEFGLGVSGSGEFVGVKGVCDLGFGVVAEGPMGAQVHGKLGDGLAARSDGSDSAAAVRGEGTDQAGGGHFQSGRGHGVAAYSMGSDGQVP